MRAREVEAFSPTWWSAAADDAGDPRSATPTPPTGSAVPRFDLRLTARDGRALSASAFESRTARAVCVVAPATGVPRGYYRAFAEWLCERGYAVLTLDYRDIGRNHARRPDRAGTSMNDWMELDLPAALSAARHRAALGASAMPILWVGHSLGGHALARLPDSEHVDAAIGVAAQLPSYDRWPSAHHRWAARFFFERWLPWCVATFGYLPGWALGGAEDLPAAAALDWSRWGRTPGYFAGDPSVALTVERWRGVAHFWCIDDDWVFGPRAAVEALRDVFRASPGRAELWHVHPRDVGTSRLGHFGPFRRRTGARFWSLMLDRIEVAVPRLGIALRPAR